MLTVQLLLIIATSAQLSQGFRLWVNKSPNQQAQPRRFTTSREVVPIDPAVYVKSLGAKPLIRISAQAQSIEKNSPATAAALSYIKQVAQDGLCGVPAQVYIENVFNGKPREKAIAAAASSFIEAYNAGERIPEAGACREASKAFQTAFLTGDDPILAAATAYMDNWPGVKEGNPCAVAGVEYMNAIIAGKSRDQATTIASRRFAVAFKAFGRAGLALKDTACAAASQAYWAAIPSNKKDPNTAAFSAFIDKFFDPKSRSPAYDPVCSASFDAFLDAFTSGEDLVTSRLIAGRAYLKAVTSGSSVPADSACSAATIAFNDASQDNTSSASSAAMLAYIKEASSGRGKIDPVCVAAAEAYFDAYIEKRSETAANEAAAIAYIDALEKNPDFDTNSPCGKAAKAYVDEF